ncbi:MAG TPA: thioredoxin domain-containing protein [Bacteroidales bacterium]|nr:thioredoxin domain-containing protein [Bacteroidales bacterium]
MRKYLFLIITAIVFVSCSSNNAKNEKIEESGTDTVKKVEKVVILKPEVLDEASFRQKVFDYTSGKKFKFLGEKPCLIDFYADWCAPCRKLAPILEEIAAEYGGKINVYKINTDHNPNVSGYFNVSSIPAVLLCPMQSQPQMMVGLYPKQEYVNAINQILLDTVNNQQ